jgi:hypothetical protein
MPRRFVLVVSAVVLALAAAASPAGAFHDGSVHSATMSKLFEAPNATGAVNSDLAFWGDRAYVGNYDGFRIYDISAPANPSLLVDFPCHGPQNDPVVHDNKLLFLAVDRTQTGPECGSTDTEHDDPAGWEGVRILDVSDPTKPEFITGVYTDCGAHTITMYPLNERVILLYVSSYPLRPGPTCGEVRGPEAGERPLHEKISVIRVPLERPDRARVIAEPRISYPGDPDNRFDPDEHALPGFGDFTACHDIGVFVELRLAAAACAEQAQLWRIGDNGIPDTEHPLWVYDDNTDTDGPGGGDVAVDFWHSATFSWDAKVVNFIDESFGSGCPTVTEGVGDTGRMFFLDAATGAKLSHFQLPRPEPALSPEITSYCSAHLGNVVRTPDRYLLVNAWYTGGVDVIDFTDPSNPAEIAFYDALPAGATGSDNWSAYWYQGPSIAADKLAIYATHGVESPPTGKGFQVYSADIGVSTDDLPRLNPQTQETTLASPPSATTVVRAARSAAAPDRGDLPRRRSRGARHLAP